MNTLRSFRERLGGVVKRPRVYVALSLPLAVPLFLAAVRSQPEYGLVTRAMVPPPTLRYHDLRAPHRAELPEHALILTLEKNDTLDKILTAGGLSRADSALLANELARSIDVRRLRPGHMVRFHYDQSGTVDAVQMKVTGWGEVGALRNGSTFEVKAQPAEIREVEATISAT